MADENKKPEEAVETTKVDEAAKTPETSQPEVKSSEAEKPVESTEKKAEAPAEKKQGASRWRWARPAPSNENPLSDKPLQRRWRKWGWKGWRWDKPNKEFQEILLEVRRVTRVTTGGRQLAFRAIIVIWNWKGKIGLWVAKGNDVSIAVRKATHEAYKNIVEAPITDELTVPYVMTHKYKAAIVKLMPATQGTGMKAWSSVRTVLELAGYNNILSKIIWTNNKLNNAICAIQALAKYKVWKTPPTQKDQKKWDKNDDNKPQGKDEKKTEKKESKKEVAETK